MYSSYYKWNMAIICNPPIMLCATFVPCCNYHEKTVYHFIYSNRPSNRGSDKPSQTTSGLKSGHLYLQKSLPGGIMLVEIGFSEEYFSINLYAFEVSSLPVAKNVNPQVCMCNIIMLCWNICYWYVWQKYVSISNPSHEIFHKKSWPKCYVLCPQKSFIYKTSVSL